ncbi:NfeD family protein [Salmonella enterica]|nr:NfeD family protein [Salmonella enterica]
MFWFTLFLLCIALEIITGTGWLLVISLGALSSAIVDFFLPISQEVNICFFASISILTSIIKFVYDKKHKKLDTPLVNTGHSRFKGKEFTLSDDIVNGKGQLLIGDTFWPVETLHNENYPAGTRVIVTDMQGITLKVMTIEDKNENKE